MKDYYEKVKEVLEKWPDTQDDDMKLYAILVHQSTKMSKEVGFYEAVYNHQKYGLPSYESVTRARRKVQENEPALRGKTRKKRKELEEEFRDWYSPR